jgi:hypothetical protein
MHHHLLLNLFHLFLMLLGLLVLENMYLIHYSKSYHYLHLQDHRDLLMLSLVFLLLRIDLTHHHLHNKEMFL